MPLSVSAALRCSMTIGCDREEHGRLMVHLSPLYMYTLGILKFRIKAQSEMRILATSLGLSSTHISLDHVLLSGISNTPMECGLGKKKKKL